MVSELSKRNARDLSADLDWFVKVLDTRMQLYFYRPNAAQEEAEKKKPKYASIEEITPPGLTDADSIYAQKIKQYNFNIYERLAILLAIIPHIRPQAIDVFFHQNSVYKRGFSEFGGILGKQHGGFIPTGETLVFLLAGNDLEKRFYAESLLGPDHEFSILNMIKLEVAPDEEPRLSGILNISKEYLSLFTEGKPYRPRFSMQFPAKRIQTKLELADLVLDQRVIDQVNEIKHWIEHSDTLMTKWGLGRKLRPGYRALFYGPPGTGKTMMACLLGKSANREVYRIDLSKVVSKYIGETEKRLAQVFDMAQHKDWILFFDEADALFGKRTQTKDAHDRYANQEVSYLLQRIEDFDGICILATNMKNNMDKAFIRRFESIIRFPMPTPNERLKLWEKGFSSESQLEDKVGLKELADNYEITGATIMNVVRTASTLALAERSKTISLKNIMLALQKEYEKEGRLM